MNNIQTILNKRMDRKEFIQHLGVGSLFLLGGGMFYQAIMNSQQQGKVSRATTKGYGASAYGGQRRSS
jgi:hypothetical protein